MVVFAVSTMFFHEYPLGEIMSAVGAAGLDSVEFWVETPVFWLAGQPEGEIQRAREEFSVMEGATLHAPILDLNPTSVNPVIAEVSVRFVCDSVRLAEKTGFPLVTVHPGRRTAKRPPGPADLAKFERYIRALEEVSRGSGVTVAMENMENRINALVCTPEGMRDLLDREEWLSFTLDLSHAMAGGPGVASRYIDLCGDRLVNVHVSAVREGKMHLPPSGNPEVAEILERLSRSGYRGHLTLEIEDLALQRPLSYREKIALLAHESGFMRGFFGESTNL
jgi:sugar phosphate isomerase/epimerase